MRVSEKNRIKIRIYIIGYIFLLAFLVLIVRAYQIQIIKGDYLRKKAKRDYIDEVVVLSKRGTIFDRNGEELAISVEAKSIYAHPYMIKDKKRAAQILSKVIGESWLNIFRKLNRLSPFVWIKRKVPDKIAKDVMGLRIKGIGIIDDTRRYYPGRQVAAHIIGFAGIDNQGLEGIEKRYDNILKGRKFKLIELKDALRRTFYIKGPFLESDNPKNLILTIDKKIQFKVQEELRNAVRRAHAISGQCIVLNPYTGEILAMAVVPEFNPNLFNKYRPSCWRNRVITDCYEPGSVIKPILLAAAIEEGVVSPNTIIFCENGSYKIANHIIHDVHKYGNLSVSDIIMVSSNIGAIKIGERLGYHKFCKYLRKFGFGKKTGIDLIGERSGYIREVDDSRPIDQACIFFGQGISVTSIQLAMAMAAIANGGFLMRPYIVKEIIDEHGNVLKEIRPKVIRRVISRETANIVRDIMKLVVSKNGTAPKAAIDGFEVAGKTGTAQKIDIKTGRYSNKKYISTFVGFVPAEDPKILVLVLIDEPKWIPYAGIVAAPVFKNIAQWILTYFGIIPEEDNIPLFVKENGPVNPITSNAYLRDRRLPDLKGMTIRDVLRIAYKNKIRVMVKGSGFAFKQYPRPGTPLKKIRVLRVYFRPVRSI